MGQALSSLPQKPPEPGISYLCAGLAGSAGHGGAAPPRRVALWPEGRCSSAGAMVRGSTRSVYSQRPGWRRLQDEDKSGALDITGFKLCIWQRLGWGPGVESGWSGSPEHCVHIRNALKAGERRKVCRLQSGKRTPLPPS